jgi:hypothetical protein
MGFIYVEKGTKWMCRISVPAEPGMFIGQISVGWAEVPADKQPLDTQQTVMTVASGLLYNKK